MRKRVFMTGATGFFGKNIFRHLDLRDYEIVSISRNPQHPYEYLGDVRDFKFPPGKFDYIFHGATTSSIHIPDEETTSVILEGTKHVIEFAKTQEAKLLYISSGAVYGSKHELVSEVELTNPTTAYGKAKLEAENIVESELPYSCIARCFAFVGEYLPLYAHFAIGNFIKDCLEDRPILITGNGTPLRSYLYTKDLVEWLWSLMVGGMGIYNVGSDKYISIIDLANLVRKMAQTNNEIWIMEDTKDEKPQCYAPDITKIKNYGLYQNVSLSDAIKLTLEFYGRWK